MTDQEYENCVACRVRLTGSNIPHDEYGNALCCDHYKMLYDEQGMTDD